MLSGYAIFGRTFAYIGVPPVFIGELVFVFGVVGAVTSGRLARVCRSAVAWLIMLFALLGAAGTIP